MDRYDYFLRADVMQDTGRQAIGRGGRWAGFGWTGAVAGRTAGLRPKTGIAASTLGMWYSGYRCGISLWQCSCGSVDPGWGMLFPSPWNVLLLTGPLLPILAFTISWAEVERGFRWHHILQLWVLAQRDGRNAAAAAAGAGRGSRIAAAPPAVAQQQTGSGQGKGSKKSRRKAAAKAKAKAEELLAAKRAAAARAANRHVDVNTMWAFCRFLHCALCVPGETNQQPFPSEASNRRMEEVCASYPYLAQTCTRFKGIVRDLGLRSINPAPAAQASRPGADDGFELTEGPGDEEEEEEANVEDGGQQEPAVEEEDTSGEAADDEEAQVGRHPVAANPQRPPPRNNVLPPLRSPELRCGPPSLRSQPGQRPESAAAASTEPFPGMRAQRLQGGPEWEVPPMAAMVTPPGYVQAEGAEASATATAQFCIVLGHSHIGQDGVSGRLQQEMLLAEEDNEAIRDAEAQMAFYVSPMIPGAWVCNLCMS